MMTPPNNEKLLLVWDIEDSANLDTTRSAVRCNRLAKDQFSGCIHNFTTYLMLYTMTFQQEEKNTVHICAEM